MKIDKNIFCRNIPKRQPQQFLISLLLNKLQLKKIKKIIEIFPFFLLFELSQNCPQKVKLISVKITQIKNNEN